MGPAVRWMAAVALVLLAAGRSGAGQPASAVSVNLSAAESSAGSTVVLGVTVEGPEDAHVTALEEEVRFDTRVLAFERAEVAPRGAAAGLTVAAAADVDPTDSNYSIVRLKAKAERPMSGAVVGLAFRIKDDVKTGTKTPLKNTARIAKAGQTELTEASGTDGEVVVTAEAPIFGCFFYMH